MAQLKKGNIIITNKLEKHHLDSLFNKTIDAIRIKQYFSKNDSENISLKIRKSKLFGNYINAPKIGRIGQAFFECQNDPISLKRYQDFSISWINEMRKDITPYISPIDRFRLELDEVWPYHCNLAKIGEHKLFVGLVREFQKGAYAEPHNDVISWDLVDSMQTNISNQLAVNIYLEVPEKGGALKLWDEWPQTKEDYNNMRIEDSYGVKEEMLNSDYIEITPEIGELIIFNPMRIHSVNEIETGKRLTWSCFIGLEEMTKPLQIWS